jgi:hypothetical protein
MELNLKLRIYIHLSFTISSAKNKRLNSVSSLLDILLFQINP